MVPEGAMLELVFDAGVMVAGGTSVAIGAGMTFAIGWAAFGHVRRALRAR